MAAFDEGFEILFLVPVEDRRLPDQFRRELQDDLRGVSGHVAPDDDFSCRVLIHVVAHVLRRLLVEVPTILVPTCSDVFLFV